MLAAERIGVIERAEKPIAGLTTARSRRLVDRIRREVRPHLQKYIGRDEPAVREGLAELLCTGAGVLKFLRRPEMRTLFKKADVHARETEDGDEIERVRVAQQRKRKVGAGEFGFHGAFGGC